MKSSKQSSYHPPILERFGTFRELTQIGPSLGNDFSILFGIDSGCDEEQSGDYGCGERS